MDVPCCRLYSRRVVSALAADIVDVKTGCYALAVAADAAVGSIDMEGRHVWSVFAAADAGNVAAVAADAGNAAAAAADSMLSGAGMVAIHVLPWEPVRARRGAACGRVVVIDLSDSFDSPSDSLTIPHATSRGQSRILRAIVLAAQVLAGVAPKVGYATDARPQVEELGRAFWAAAGVAGLKVRRGAISYT